MAADEAITGTGLTRREVIVRALTAAGATTVLGSSTLLGACASTGSARSSASSFSPEEIAWLDEVAETLLPETDTPGAKAAAVGAFVAIMVTDCYDPGEQRVFRSGMTELEGRCRERFGAGVLSAGPSQRLELLEALDAEQLAYMSNRAPGAPPHYFRQMKELMLLGYFTSEIGYTQALRYAETPGNFEPCVEHAPGERLWARHA
jgi:hypothetical protein